MSFKAWHIVVLSVAFGILVWFSVAISDEYQVTVQAPLRIENVPPGKAISSSIPPTLTLRLHGKGWQMASALWMSDLALTFPVQMFTGGKRAITFSDVAEKLSSKIGVQLVEMSPDSIFVQLDQQMQKTVPIVLDCQMTFRDGYGQVGQTVVVPDSVTVFGAGTVLRSIDSWSTVRGAFENLRAPLETDLQLAPAGSRVVVLSVPQVHISADVEPFAEKTVSGLVVEVKEVAPSRELILIPPKIDVVIRGGIRQLSTIAADDFHVSVDYRDVVVDSSGYVDATILAPPGVQVVARKPEHLQFVVRRRL